MEYEQKFYIGRHSNKIERGQKDNPEYPGLSQEGVEKGTEKAKELKNIIDKLPERSIFWFGGATETIRTKSTSKTYGEGLENLYKGDKNVVVITKTEIDEIIAKNPSGKILNEFKNIITSKENKNKKIIIDNPLFIKQFSFLRRWKIFDEMESPYFQYLKKKYGDNEEKQFQEWIETKGKSEELEGPDPEKIAEEYLLGLERLNEFTKEIVPDRPINIGTVTHRLDLDAAILKLIKGEVTMQVFEEISGGELTDPNEGTLITFYPNGDKRIFFRGNEYEINSEDKNEKQL